MPRLTSDELHRARRAKEQALRDDVLRICAKGMDYVLSELAGAAFAARRNETCLRHISQAQDLVRSLSRLMLNYYDDQTP